ncbi:MAG TPA: TMAO reductase system periplasmic protein TorT [Thauera sp.]|nr:TMAO reductase system periplasmic protein TorT [Thauera sp.]
MFAALLPMGSASASEWPLERWAGDGRASASSTQPAPSLPRMGASRPWTLCAVYPHLKDSYWLAVNFGMVEEARALGLGLRVLEGAGYEALERQRRSVTECLTDGRVDALLVGTVSFAGLNDLLAPQRAQRPVIGLVNDIDAEAVRAKIGVPWYQLGWQIGRWLAERHPAGAPAVEVAWLPGPLDANWVVVVDRGFRAAIADSAVRIATVRGGDTGRSIQRQLVEEVLDAHTGLAYLVGNAPMAEAAVAELRRRGREDAVGIVSLYVTPGVYSGLLRGRIQVSVSDFPVLQGRLAVRQALHALEGRALEPYLGPRVERVDADALARYPVDWMLPPAGFVPVYEVAPAQATPARP